MGNSLFECSFVHPFNFLPKCSRVKLPSITTVRYFTTKPVVYVQCVYCSIYITISSEEECSNTSKRKSYEEKEEYNIEHCINVLCGQYLMRLCRETYCLFILHHFSFPLTGFWLFLVKKKKSSFFTKNIFEEYIIYLEFLFSSKDILLMCTEIVSSLLVAIRNK